jgi:hypothetical protein
MLKTRKLATGFFATALLASALIVSAAGPASASVGPSKHYYYSNLPSCAAKEIVLVETGHKIYQKCTADAWANGRVIQWRLLVW